MRNRVNITLNRSKDYNIYLLMHPVCGFFDWKSKEIILMARKTAEFEEVLDTLIHEINHWAAASGISEKETSKILRWRAEHYDEYASLPYPERILERHADHFEQRSQILRRD